MTVQKFSTGLAAAVALTLLIAPPAMARDNKKSAGAVAATGSGSVIATVNGVAIPANYADAMIAAQQARGQEITPELKNAIREELIRRQLLVQQATNQGVDKQPEVRAQMELARQGVLVGSYISDYLRSRPVTDAELKKEFDRISANTGDKEYSVAHILVDSEADAKTVIEKLKAGGSFADLAKQYSKDNESKDKAGTLGWAPPSAYLKPMAEAMTKLEKGKFTDTPVRSDFGYHVILLQDIRPITPPSFEQAKPQLTQRLQASKVEELIVGLRAKANIK